jgi:hypothetical protein
VASAPEVLTSKHGVFLKTIPTLPSTASLVVAVLNIYVDDTHQWDGGGIDVLEPVLRYWFWQNTKMQVVSMYSSRM